MRSATVVRSKGARRSALAFLLLANLVVSSLLAAGLPVFEKPEIAPAPALLQFNAPAASALAAPPSPQAEDAPRLAPTPLTLGVGTPENWSPYAPSAFSHQVIRLATGGNSVDFSNLPNLFVNQAGTVTVVVNGTWNPLPIGAVDRDWVMVVFVLNGRADVVVMESNTTRTVTLGASQLPAFAFFALPSSVGFLNGRSNASVLVTHPAGNSTRLNLTIANAGLSVVSQLSVRPVLTKSLWSNATGFYTGNGVLSGTQNVSVIVPNDDQPPIVVHRSDPRQWVGDSHFPGGRLFLLHGGGGVVTLSNMDIILWTRGSPESGLFVNATVSPSEVKRGENVSVGGVVGNRSLLDSTSWTTGGSPLAAQRLTANCQNVIRLDNGSYRMFCNYETNAVLLLNRHGVDSAWSPNGVNWGWEPGARYERCNGGYALNSIAIVKLFDGRLRMFYGGRDPGAVLGCGGATTHVSSAVSSDEGATWADETDNVPISGSTLPSLYAVVPTVNGDLRMYLDSSGSFVSALSSDGTSFAVEAAISATAPRVMYLLSDGSYKLYAGTSTIISQTSPDGLTWNGTRNEIVGWSADMRAGPLVDRGTGTLVMIGYSPSTGVHVAGLTGTPFNTTSGRFSGQISDGTAFARVAFATNSAARFQENVTIPQAGPPGRARIQAAGWFGGPTVRVNVTNRVPVWSSTASLTAVEDVDQVVDLLNFTTELDPPDNLTFIKTGGSGVLVGSQLTLNYPNGVLNDTVTGYVSDGYDLTPFVLVVTVTPVNDAPTITANLTLPVVEDSPTPVNFTLEVFDPDSPLSAMVVTTDAPGATWNGTVVTFLYNLPGTYAVTLTVSDGQLNSTVPASVTVSPVPDAPILGLDPIYQGQEDVQITVDVGPALFDEDTPFDSIVVTTNLSGATVNGFNITLTRNSPGAIPFSVTVNDGSTSVTDTSVLEVLPTNDPPVWTSFEIRDLTEDVPAEFDVAAFVSDPDNATSTLQFSVVSPHAAFNGSVLEMLWPEGFTDVDLTLRVSDGTSVRFQTVRVRIDSVNDAPTLTGTPPNSSPSGAPVSFQFGVIDPDDATGFVFLLVTGPSWVTVTISGLLTITIPAGVYGNVSYTVRVQDDEGAQSAAVTFSFELPPATPVVSGTIPPFNGTRDQVLDVDLTPFMTDGDDALADLTWVVDASGAPFVTATYDPSTRHLLVTLQGVGDGTIQLTLKDPANHSVTVPVAVHSTEPGVPPGGEKPTTIAGFPWWLLLVIGGGAGVGLYLWRRGRGTPALLEPATATRPPLAEAAPARPVVVPAAGRKRTFLVEDLFLLYKDGRTIYTRSGLAADAVEDLDSVGSMLVAVQDFVHDSFRRGSPVDRMGYGDNVILIEKGDSLILAVTVFGEPDREFRDLMIDTVRKVEMTFAGLVESWDGDRTSLVGVEGLLAPIWQLTAHLTRGDVLLATTAREVQMLSGVEFFQGFIRLKVGVVNNTPSVITNVTVDLDHNADVLRLHKIEPGTYKSAGAKVNLGVLQAGEKATLAYYFDPQICTQSAIDGSCRYKDHEGRQHIVQMKSRQAEVVCPLFFTKEQANTAMLKRLVETELKTFDVRAYAFQPGSADTSLSPLYEALKSTVMAHDVQLVRSFERRRPYVGEAWFYGKTQVKGYQMVIRAAVDQERGRAEFFVASTAMRSVTGLLAELNHTFQSAIAGRFAELGLAPLFEPEVRESYADPRAVSKMVEGEADPSDNEPA